jgi:hypothetical protein
VTAVANSLTALLLAALTDEDSPGISPDHLERALRQV